jgi:pimeloyl-ACP methyl ester carboxylesterase
MRVKYIDVGGVKTRCIFAGKEGAPALLLVHSMTYPADLWLRNIDALAEDRYVVAPDMLGHGFTKPDDDWSGPVIARKVEHLCALLDTLGLKTLAIAGSSYGALVALLVHLARPEQVDRIVINGSGSAFNTEAELGTFIAKSLQSTMPTIASSTPQMWRESLGKGVFDPQSIPSEILQLQLTIFAQPWVVAAWERSMRELMEPQVIRPYRVLERLETIKAPTLIVWGREDPGAPYSNAVAAAKRMPNARLEVLERCGHMPMYEHPVPYNALVRSFLAAA